MPVAQKPKMKGEELTPEQKAREAKFAELDNLERRFHEAVQKRNELNSQAKLLREERDQLNDARRGFLGKLDGLKKERDHYNALVREHKAKRNEYQAAAKGLLAEKTAKKGGLKPSVGLQAQQLKHEIQMLEYKQETTVLTNEKENALIKEIQIKRKLLASLQSQLTANRALKIDLTDKDKAIDELFAKADEEHKLVEQYFKLSNERHQQFMKLVEEASILITNANAKHKAYEEARAKAQEQHDKATESRTKIMDIKGQDRRERDEARAIIREQRAEVSKKLGDPSKLEEHASSVFEQLKKGGKITLG